MPRRLIRRRLGIARGTNYRGAGLAPSGPPPVDPGGPPDPVETFRVITTLGAFVKRTDNAQVIHG